MAVLADMTLSGLRRVCQAGGWSKAQINAALQAIEDTFEGPGRTALNNAIETAAPGIFDANQKRALVKAYLLAKFNLGG